MVGRHGQVVQQGFSLIELLVSVAVLSIVVAVVVDGITTMLNNNSVETNKVDLTQESREFMDQVTNDLRQSGFPRPSMFDPTTLTPAASPTVPPDCRVYATLACGLRDVSQTAIRFEGDVDGTGVSEEWIQLVQSNGGNAACTAPPCVLQRGVISKAAYLGGGTPTFYTELNGVMNTNIFTAYDNNGVDLGPNGTNILPLTDTAYASGYNIKAIGVTMYVKSSQPDPRNGQYPKVTMVSSARVND